MRKMFSKNQIEKIINDVLSNNEVLSKITWNSEDETLDIMNDVYLGGNAEIEGLLKLIGFGYIKNEDGDSLQDKLDELKINIDDEYLSVNCNRVQGSNDMLSLPADFALEDGIYLIFFNEPDGDNVLIENSLFAIKDGVGSVIGSEAVNGAVVRASYYSYSSLKVFEFVKADGTHIDLDDYDAQGDNILYFCKLF